MLTLNFLEQIPVIGWIMNGTWATQGVRASIAGAVAGALLSAGGWTWTWINNVNETIQEVETIQDQIQRWRKYQEEAQADRQQLKENQQSILDHLQGRFGETGVPNTDQPKGEQRMKLKPGARLLGIRPEIAVAMSVVDGIMQDHCQELVATSVVDGTHSWGSKHYAGAAFDARTRFFSDREEVEGIGQELQDALGQDFDVVVEDTHIHVEWQPKEAY